MNGWTHIGRLWTNGDPYLAVDDSIRHRWLGASRDEYFDRIVFLDEDEIGIALGDRTAAVVGADGMVGDDSWMEVFESADGSVAIVQAAGYDYRATLAAALDQPEEATDPGTRIEVPSGELALFSAACDGTGECSMRLLRPQPGPAPTESGGPIKDDDTGLLITARSASYRVTATSDAGRRFARWLLIPEQPRA